MPARSIVMDRLIKMDTEQFISQMRVQTEAMMRRIGEAVNNAPDGNVISGSERAVREAILELGKFAQQQAVQMRIDSTESSFSPSA
jgi:hypothetical protein